MNRSWRRVLGAPWPDIVVAGVLVIAAVVTTVLDRHVLHPVTEIAAVAAAGAVVLRTRAPLLMAAIAAAACLILAQLPGASTPLWAFATVLILAFSVGVHLTGIRAAIALALVLAATFVMQAGTSAELVEILLTPIIIVGAPALAGWLLARARAQAERLRRLTAELAEERERHAVLAAAAERARITRDLHDILAHTLSSIAVQAGAAQQLLPLSAPAREPVEHIMSAAHEALGEVRSLLILARGEGSSRVASGDGTPDAGPPGIEPPRTEPQGSTHRDADPRPGLDRLPELLAAEGIEPFVDGVPVPVPSGVSLAAFRIVQEALTNARRHAPGEPISVAIRYGQDALRLVIENGGPPSRTGVGGLGLIGMAERAAAHEGSMQAGPGEDGRGWAVRARLPYRAHAAGIVT